MINHVSAGRSASETAFLFQDVFLICVYVFALTHMHLCVHVGMYTDMHKCKCPWRPGALDPSGNGVSGSCEPPYVGARKQTPIL